ncbi:MAG: hypothetical protein VB118_01690 [Oscillospiraceae bacterium]|nr:hypothetical protein [Oscillospiraceae bacterium]
MLIDTCTYIGHWPFRKLPQETLPELCEYASKRMVTHMFVTNLNAVFYKDTCEGNIELIKAVKAYKGDMKIYPFAVVNPAYICFEREIKEYKEMGFAGIELTPCYHAYSLDSDCARKAYVLAGENGLMVKVSAGFENIRQRHWMDNFSEPTGDQICSMAKASDKTVTVINAQFPASLGGGFATLCKERANVFADVMRCDSFVGKNFDDAISVLGAEHLVFGTMAPFKYIEPQFVKLFSTKATNDIQKSQILYQNMQKILGI